MARRVIEVTPEVEAQMLRMPTRRVIFSEQAGPYRYFAYQGRVHDYGWPITFVKGESITLG
jgi:hypothetical protein